MSGDPLVAATMGGAEGESNDDGVGGGKDSEDGGSGEDEIDEDGSKDGGSGEDEIDEDGSKDGRSGDEDKTDDSEDADGDAKKGDGGAAIADDLGNLSLNNRAYRPHRDQKASHGGVEAEGELPVHTSYLHGNRETLRMLVKKSITKKHKQQTRQTQPKRDSRSVCTRSNKTKRGAMKDALDSQGGWW